MKEQIEHELPRLTANSAIRRQDLLSSALVKSRRRKILNIIAGVLTALLGAEGFSGQVHGLGATRQGQLVGIAHCLFHASTWADSACYLQDLYTDTATRGQGVARMLIEAVAGEARARGASRFYWLTQRHNTAARRLYDHVARHTGFVRYDYTL